MVYNSDNVQWDISHTLSFSNSFSILWIFRYMTVTILWCHSIQSFMIESIQLTELIEYVFFVPRNLWVDYCSTPQYQYASNHGKPPNSGNWFKHMVEICDIFLVCELCSIPIYDTANPTVGPIWMETWHFPFCWTRSKFSNMRELKCKPGFTAAGHWFSSLFTNFSTTTPASWYIQQDLSTGQDSIWTFHKDLNLGKGVACSQRMSWLWCKKHKKQTHWNTQYW